MPSLANEIHINAKCSQVWGYSVHSRLIGENVDVRIYAEHIEAWYAQRRIEILPILRGENGHYINYRHVIDTLVRKPGAFENYRYKDDMFPTSQFRIAYDILRNQYGDWSKSLTQPVSFVINRAL